MKEASRAPYWLLNQGCQSTTWGDIDPYNVHITPYYGGERLPDGRPYHQIKLELLAGVYRTLSCYTNRLRILCADFNTPQEEMPGGEIITWGYDKRMGNYTLARPYQHEVEFKVLRGLASFTSGVERLFALRRCPSGGRGYRREFSSWLAWSIGDSRSRLRGPLAIQTSRRHPALSAGAR
jgi:hypothetical protein